MASPRRTPAAGSGDKENICQERDGVSDCPTLRQVGAVSTKRKKKPGGFNLRKSIAWNPAFFTEEGVLDNVELSMLSGSELKANGSPSSGCGGTISPSCRFGKSGNTSVLKEVAENSRGKFPAKFRTTENKGRKLFSSAKTSERDEREELVGTQDKRSARSIQKCIPRPPAGYTQKKVPNSSATAQVSRTPKKSQPSLPMIPRSTSSVTNISKSNIKLAPVKTEHTRRVEGLPPKSKIKPTSLTKSSGPNVEKDVVPAEEANGFGKHKTFSPLQNSPSSSVGVPASTFAKPSALRMPSPSVGFFTQGKASMPHGNTAQRNTERCITGNTSSPVKPPRRNAERCFTGNTSSLVKPPRYKQPEDLQSRLGLTKQLPTNCSTALNLVVQPVTSESTLNTLASSFPGLEHADVCSAKESLSKGIVTHSAKPGNTDNQEMPEVGCLSAEKGAPTHPLSSEKNDGARNGMPNAYNDASHVEGRGIVKGIYPTEDSRSLKTVCSSTIEPVAYSCSLKAICSSTKHIVRSKLSSSCIPSQVCTPNDLSCQRKSDNCASAAIDLQNSLAGETAVAVSFSEGNNCTPGPDFLQDFDSCDQQNTSTLMESTICVDQVPQCGSSSDIKPALADSKSDLDGSLCNEAQPASLEEPNNDGRMELDMDKLLIVKDAQLVHVGCECHHDYKITECSPMKLAAPMPCVDQKARAADLVDLEAVTVDSRTELHDTLTEERQSVLSEEPYTEDNMEIDTNKLSDLEGSSHIKKNKAVDKSGANTTLKDHLKHLVPFTEEWLAVMEACGEEVLEQKSGAVQNSPTDKATPEPSSWSPVKRKAQDVGPFDCTKYSKSVRTSTSPLL